MATPPLVAAHDILFLAELLKIIFGGEVQRVDIFVSSIQSHNVTQESELNLQAIHRLLAHSRSRQTHGVTSLFGERWPLRVISEE